MQINELNQIRVNWQLAVVICALAIFPIAGVVMAEPPLADSQVRIGCGAFIIITLLLAVLAVRSRLGTIASRNERAECLRRIARGLGTITVAAGVTAVLAVFGAFSMFGWQFFLVPTGLYVVGLVTIGKAMVPERQ